MNSKDPRARLARATTGEERRRAVSSALAEGMPLREIEQYLDWVDAVRAGQAMPAAPPKRWSWARWLGLARKRRQDLSGD